MARLLCVAMILAGIVGVTLTLAGAASSVVIPAKAGIQSFLSVSLKANALDPPLRRDSAAEAVGRLL